MKRKKTKITNAAKTKKMKMKMKTTKIKNVAKKMKTKTTKITHSAKTKRMKMQTDSQTPHLTGHF